jgi:putative membrane protein
MLQEHGNLIDELPFPPFHKEEPMMRAIVIGISLATASAVAVVPLAWAQNAKPESKLRSQSFLKNAAEMQQAQISLALLVDQRATNKRVNQFAEEMITVHKRIRQEIQQIAAEKGVQLSSELSEEHKQKIKELTQLSGHAFDREYMNYILRDHQHDVNEFEESLQTVEDPAVLHWTYKTLPMLRAHVEDARWIKMMLFAMD